ncbi:MAG: DUF2721 domain-containing protein [Erysipelothrix sp.]|nr:DUF2721 domain-containing protein [Erysipelothrix sp.]
MDFTFSTPAVVFSATSLLMLAYTNRFLTLSELTRNLYNRYKDSNGKDNSAKGQIDNLKLRLKIIRWMQIFGAVSFSLSVVSMLAMVFINDTVSLSIFIISLFCLLVSLGLLVYELQISVKAITIQLNEMKE